MIYWKVDLSLPYYCWYPIELMASSQPMNGFTNIITISWELLTFNLQTRFHSIEELLGINFTIHANKWKIIFCWIIYMFSIKIIKKNENYIIPFQIWYVSHQDDFVCMEKKIWCCHRRKLWCCFIQVGLNLYVISKRTSWELEGTQRLLPRFKSEHLEHARTSQPTPISPKGKPLGSHMVGWQYLAHPYTPTLIGSIIGGRVQPEMKC